MFNPFSKSKKIATCIENVHSLEKRMDSFLHISANENVMSQTARQFLATPLTERYFFGGGTHGVVSKRALDSIGLPEVAALVDAAQKSACRHLNAALISFDLLSGIHAMLATLLSVTEPHEMIMTIDNKYGGHFMTNSVVERIGRGHVTTVHDEETGRINAEGTAELFKKKNAKVLYLDMMSVREPLPLSELRTLLGSDACIIFDASHTLGLIIGKAFQSPLREGANIMVANTHKTFPGPQKALIAFKDKGEGNRILSLMKKGLYSSVHTNNMIALAVTMMEMDVFGAHYAKQIVANANMLGKSLDERGLVLRKTSRGDYSQTHQLTVLLDPITERAALAQNLEKNNISFTVIHCPSGKEYLRFGTQELTRRGMKEEDMAEVAAYVHGAIQGKNMKKSVIALTDKFTKIHYSFDEGI